MISTSRTRSIVPLCLGSGCSKSDEARTDRLALGVEDSMDVAWIEHTVRAQLRSLVVLPTVFVLL